MATKSNSARRRRGAATSGDAASHERLQGSSELDSVACGTRSMPHERDESARTTGNRVDESLSPAGREIEQAHEDVERGLTDTDRRGVPDDIPSVRENSKR